MSEASNEEPNHVDFGGRFPIVSKALHEKHLTSRTRTGWSIGGVGFVIVLSTAGYAFARLAGAAPPAPGNATFFYVVTGAQTAISLALVLFGYQLVRAAERMLLPHWVAEQHPEAAKVLLGIEDPVRGLVKTTERLITAVAGAVRGPDRT